MTVTAPPEGILRQDLNQLVSAKAAEFAGLPLRSGRRVAFSGRKLRDYLLGESDPIRLGRPAEPVTDELPVVRPEDLPRPAPRVVGVRAL